MSFRSRVKYPLGTQPAIIVNLLESDEGACEAMVNPMILGDVKIHRIVEQEGPFFDMLTFFPDLTDELLGQNLHWLQPRFTSPKNQLMLCFQSYLVQTPHHNILIDTCIGNHKMLPARPFWHMMDSDRYQRNFAATGVGLADVDFVLCTHLHADHLGWNTQLKDGNWVPTFPRARYLFTETELGYSTGRHREEPASFPWTRQL
ncbi:MBL fold metallo-hydrolase [Streptomyces sp. NPDC057910]|uniref:MBL fold metallo-hydrolase n=1 Tax=Streptomyces sp. NPDC057910 TaxID=3346278 RepID=UPI0036E76887